MELKPVIVKTKCDNGACRNMADYEIVKEGTMPSVRLKLCKDCLIEIGKLAHSFLDNLGALTT